MHAWCPARHAGRANAASNDELAPRMAQVVKAVVEALQQLEDEQTANLEAEAVTTLEDTLARMTRLYAQHEQLELAIETSRESLARAFAWSAPAQPLRGFA